MFLLYFRLFTFSDLYWVCLPVFSCTVLFVSISQVIGCEDRLRNDLYCVEWGVIVYSIHPCWRGYLSGATERGADLHSLWPSRFHCHSLSLASGKSRLVLPFWYRLTRVVPEKGPLNGCVCVCVSNHLKTQFTIVIIQWKLNVLSALLLVQQ